MSETIKKNITKEKKKGITEIPFKPCLEFTMDIIKENDPRKWKAIADQQRVRFDVTNVDLPCDPRQTLVSIIGKKGLKKLQEDYRYRHLSQTMTLQQYCEELQCRYMSNNITCTKGLDDETTMNNIFGWWQSAIYTGGKNHVYFKYIDLRTLFAFFDNLVLTLDVMIQPVINALKPAMVLFTTTLKKSNPDIPYADGAVTVDGKMFSLADILKIMKQ